MAGIGKYKKGKAFQLKSGNKPTFKMMGSSPLQSHDGTILHTTRMVLQNLRENKSFQKDMRARYLKQKQVQVRIPQKAKIKTKSLTIKENTLEIGKGIKKFCLNKKSGRKCQI